MIGPARTLRFAEILDLPDVFLRRHFKALLAIAIPGLFLANIPGFITNWLAYVGGPVNPADPSILLWTYGGGAISMLILIVTWTAVIRAITVRMDGGMTGVGSAYLFALHPLRFFAGLVAVTMTTIGCCMLIVPGVVVLIFVSLLVPVMTHEWNGVIDSFSRSVSLAAFVPASRGFSAAVVWRLLGLWLLYFALSTALSGFQFVPIVIGQSLDVWRVATAEGAVSGPAWWMGALLASGSLVGVFLSAILLSYIGTSLVLLYRDVRYRREAIDLHHALDARLEADPGRRG